GDEAGHATRCYTAEISSGQSKSVTPEGVLCGPSSPDGTSLIGTSPNHSIAIYSLNGAAPRPIPSLAQNFVAVQWSDDGSFLYAYHQGEFQSKIYSVKIATGKEIILQELSPGVPAGIAMVAPIVVSRDGKKFAYSYNQTLSVLYLISGLK